MTALSSAALIAQNKAPIVPGTEFRIGPLTCALKDDPLYWRHLGSQLISPGSTLPLELDTMLEHIDTVEWCHLLVIYMPTIATWIPAHKLQMVQTAERYHLVARNPKLNLAGVQEALKMFSLASNEYETGSHNAARLINALPDLIDGHQAALELKDRLCSLPDTVTYGIPLDDGERYICLDPYEVKDPAFLHSSPMNLVTYTRLLVDMFHAQKRKVNRQYRHTLPNRDGFMLCITDDQRNIVRSLIATDGHVRYNKFLDNYLLSIKSNEMPTFDVTIADNAILTAEFILDLARLIRKINGPFMRLHMGTNAVKPPLKKLPSTYIR